MSLSRLEKFDKLFANDTKPAIPDRTKPHAVDQGFITNEILISHEIESSHHPKMEADPVRAQKQMKSVQVVAKPVEASPPSIGDIDQITSSEDSDDYVSTFKFRRAPKMRVRSGNDRPLTSPQNFPEKDQNGNLLAGVYCQIEVFSRFPYKCVEQNASERVAKHFFNEGKFWEQNTWTIYYLHVPDDEFQARPLILTPMDSVQSFMNQINSAFKSDLFVPTDPRDGMVIPFYKDGTPLPRYLGKIRSKNSFTEMRDSIGAPPSNYGKPPKGASPAVDRSFAAWNKKVQTVAQASKRKAKTLKKKKNGDRLHQQQDWYRASRRAERYLGLRPVAKDPRDIDTSTTMSWEESEALRKQQESDNGRMISKLDLTKPAPYSFDFEPIIVCVDVESNERNHNQITEIGVSTLDTRDIKTVAPGRGAENWMKLIRSRHFRISEYSHITNTDFCVGAPNKFEFGSSEFVNLDHAAEAVDSCFRWPYSAGFEHDGKFKPEEAKASPKAENASKTISDVGNPADASAKERTSRATSPDFGAPLTPEASNGPSNDEQSAANEIAVTKILGDVVSVTETAVKDIVGKTKKIASRANTTSDLDEASEDKQPASDTSLDPTRDAPEARNIIFLGHDLGGDFTYLRKLGSTIFDAAPTDTHEVDPKNSSISDNILEPLDTALLYRVYSRETQNRSLTHVITAFERTGWHMHCAGNDARYTLEVFLAMTVAMREKEDREASGEGAAKANREWNEEKERRVKEKLREAEESVMTEVRGWDLVENRDAGVGVGTGNGAAGEGADSSSKAYVLQTGAMTYAPPDTFARSAADIDGGRPPRSWAQIAAEFRGLDTKKKPSAQDKRRADDMWARGVGEAGPATFEPDEEIPVLNYERW